MTTRDLAGYDFGKAASAVSPVSDDALRQLEQTVEWTEADAALLNKHLPLFRERAESMVESWRAVISAQPHLAEWFRGPDGAPDDDYKARVKARFVQWVIDVASRSHDRDWLNYQEEIGLRHTPAKKNATDHKHTPPLVPFRYLLAFVAIVLPVRKFFAAAIHSPDELDGVEMAWRKAACLHIALWARPYTIEGLW
ncbi:MAG TPA: protoglobin domain-containing protein [Bryobacteraceae bacterium]|nr:protoglobin domain-containing protein [Bryobacteraceae bacterium]